MKTGNFSRRTAILGGFAALALPRGGWGQEREIEGGIGGTGIVGVLTDFGSLVVGGRLVASDRETVITDGFGPVPESSLAIGDSLTVEASGSADALIARRVHVTHPLVGEITQISRDLVVINGTEVVLPSGARSAQIGQRVAVSGLWRENRVIASRLSPARSDLDLVAGDVTRGLSGVAVGGVPVTNTLPNQASGSFATVSGRYNTDADRLVVQTARGDRFTEAAGPLRELAVEGYLEPTTRAPGFRISGLGHSFARNLNLAQFADERVLFDGPYVDTFAADTAVVLPEDANRRRQLLRLLASQA
ncbi:MAG: DUF5666 domain-containing protein [Pseudomonadota bacterium]